MKVLLIGATGYIGGTIALSFRRKSHTVFGTARSPEDAAILAQNEVTVIPDQSEDSEAFSRAIAEHGIDAIVDLTTGGALKRFTI
jgi:nucleoside-diphosphate-sugar epimerase